MPPEGFAMEGVGYSDEQPSLEEATVTHTKPSARGSRVVDLTGDSSLVDENALGETFGENVPDDLVSRDPVSEELGRTSGAPAGEQGVAARFDAFMRTRPWLALAALALVGFLIRRMLTRSDGQLALPPGTLIEIPPGSRLRVVEGGR